MKYNLHINQKKIIELNLKIDLLDACILDFMYSFSNSPDIEKKIYNNKLFCWFKYSYIVDELPLLGLKQDSVYRRIKAMIDLGLLETHPDNQILGKSFFSITKLAFSLFYEANKPTDNNPNPYGSASVPPTDENPYYNNIIDYTSLSNDKEDIDKLAAKFSEHNPNEKRKKVATKKESAILMREAITVTVEALRFNVMGTMYDKANLEFYYESALHWSNSMGKKRLDWISVIKGFMLRDYRLGKMICGEISQEQKVKTMEDMLENWEVI